jgi:uncharacterized protein
MSGNKAFHDGERTVQVRAGEDAIADRNIAMMSDTVIGGARPFIAKQFMVALGSTDANGNVWASLLFGKPGFMHTTDGHAIEIDVPVNQRDADEPFWANVDANKDVGMLFIELGSRRRYRVNGTVTRLDAAGIEVSIAQAYPNCPRYIHRRHLRALGETGLMSQTASGTVLRGSVETLIAEADTLFIASHHAQTGADASHRGGGTGFIHQVDERTLRIPDFNGNSMFNTWGNLTLDPRAGLCIPDFANGRLLQLTGTARLLWDQDDPNDNTGGTGRFLEFRVDRWVLRDAIPRAEWEELDPSPFNPPVTR